MPTNLMTNNAAWRTLFVIHQKELWVEDGDLGSHFDRLFHVVNIHNGEVVATSKSLRNAQKRASRLHKKFTDLLEKSFMSEE